jgi:hypothetical protein
MIIVQAGRVEQYLERDSALLEPGDSVSSSTPTSFTPRSTSATRRPGCRS